MIMVSLNSISVQTFQCPGILFNPSRVEIGVVVPKNEKAMKKMSRNIIPTEPITGQAKFAKVSGLDLAGHQRIKQRLQ
jgi:hypothetical protein